MTKLEKIHNIQGTSQEIKVLIADDHKLVVDAISDILTSEGRFATTVEYDLNGCLKQLENEHFDVVMLDMNMPGMVGLVSVKEVIKAAGEGFVVIFTGQIDEYTLEHAIDMGARGLITKGMSLKSLVSIIEVIHSGQVFVPVNSFTTDTHGKSSQRATLSEKQIHVLKLASDGHTNKEIAHELTVSEVAIKQRMRGICKKLGARNRAQASLIARELALL
ncbi:response regulator transcription factor [Celeribacter marinus]|uniref:response regulator transcription factor n=1 Tax=Celeribacter marinus TaxID=1397108 RepID=UPI00318251FA